MLEKDALIEREKQIDYLTRQQMEICASVYSPLPDAAYQVMVIGYGQA